MNKLQRFKVLFRAPKAYFMRWLQCLTVQYHNPDLILTFPIFWLFDEIEAIQISNVLIGAFSEIVVLAKSPYTKVSGRLIIEDQVVIGAHANIRATGGEIFIGRNALIAQQVSLIASNHTISSKQPYGDLPWDESKTGIYIDENVWIGSGVTILPGCVIGRNSVIGAGSVVTKSVPAGEIWAGVPARKVRDIVDRTDINVLVNLDKAM
jgi:acetyltransferase-like isoleucine patch superfamily enzyme